MNLRRVSEPLYEPVSVDEAMLHSRVDSDVEYGYIANLITAARAHVEDVLWRSLMGTEWEMQYDAWPGERVIELPMAPLRSVTSIKYVSDAGVESTFSSSNTVVDTWSEPGRIALKDGTTWPTTTLQKIGGVRIRYVAGYADLLTSSSDQPTITAARNAVPERCKQAIKLIIGHLYENREEVVIGAGLTLTQLPMGVDALLWPTRVMEF